MGVMNFSIPDDVKEAFNLSFEGENKSAIISELMRHAIEERDRQRKRTSLIEQMRQMRGLSGRHSSQSIETARLEGRN